MFGKDQHENEQSEDEDWGPRSRRQRRRSRPESNDGADNGSCGDADQEPEEQFNTDSQMRPPCISQERKCLFRIPREAVEVIKSLLLMLESPFNSFWSPCYSQSHTLFLFFWLPEIGDRDLV